MEDMKQRCLSKPPLYPDNKSHINPAPIKMVFPSTLSKAFEKTPYYMNVMTNGAGKNDAVSAEKVVDLNVPPSQHVIIPKEEKLNKKTKTNNSSPINEKHPIHDNGVESGASSNGKRILTLDEAVENEKGGRDINPEDERKLRRTVSNRLSAQRTRMRKSVYIAELQKKIKELQENIEDINPKLESFKQGKTMLRMQKTVLEQQLKSCISKSTLCNRQIEEKRDELRRLRELYRTQKDEMMMYAAANPKMFYRPENYLQMPSTSIFQYQLKRPAVMEVSTDQGGIEQYLNLDALGMSSGQPKI